MTVHAATPAHSLNSPSVDDRLNLSLDDLIRERKKESKKDLQQKKRETVKQQSTTVSTKAEKKKMQKKNVSDDQSYKRKAQVNKNRGLPSTPKVHGKGNGSETAPATISKNMKRNKNKKTAAAPKNSPAAKATPSPPPKQKNKKPFNTIGGQRKKIEVVMQKPQQRQKQQQVQKQQPSSKQKKPTLSPKQHQAKVKLLFSAGPGKSKREVNKVQQGGRLQMTVNNSKAEKRRVKHEQTLVYQPPMRRQSAKALKVVLPGKVQPKTRKMLAQKIVKKAKISRKQTSKNGKFIVRRPVVVRKA